MDSNFNPRLLPFIYTNSLPDQLSKLAYELLPPTNADEELPAFWVYKDQEAFQKKFAHLGTIVWSRRNSYHLLFIAGLKVARAWTSEKYMRVELNANIAAAVSNTITGVTQMKSAAPYSAWVSIRNEAEVKQLITAIKRTYGV